MKYEKPTVDIFEFSKDIVQTSTPIESGTTELPITTTTEGI